MLGFDDDFQALLAFTALVGAAAVLLRELVDVPQGFIASNDLDDPAANLDVPSGMAGIGDTQRHSVVAGEVSLLLVAFDGVDQDCRAVVVDPDGRGLRRAALHESDEHGEVRFVEKLLDLLGELCHRGTNVHDVAFGQSGNDD
jgi:hypothetical protein